MRFRLTFGLVACMIFVSLLAGPALAKDYSSVPPSLADFARALENSKVDLVSAMKIAEQRINGKATRGEAMLADGKVVFKIDLAAPGIEATVMVDGSTGNIVSTPNPLTDGKVSLIDAAATAQKAGKGKAISLSLVNENARPSTQPADENTKAEPITVRVIGTNVKKDIAIDAINGNTTSTTELSPSMLPGEAVKGEPTKTASGLIYYEVKIGDGEQPPNASSMVKVHYTGWLNDGTKFDSSVDRNRPATFPLNRVIPGWSEGLLTMKVGGKRKLLIPYDLAYGEYGRPPRIPAKALLIFDVELLEIASQPKMNVQPKRPARPTTRPTAK